MPNVDGLLIVNTFMFVFVFVFLLLIVLCVAPILP